MKLEAERRELQSEMAVAAELIQKAVPASAPTRHNPESQKHLDGLIARFEDIKTRLAAITETITSRNTRRDKLDTFLTELAQQPDVITEWDERLWLTLVDYATAHTNTDIRFTFKDGTEIKTG